MSTPNPARTQLLQELSPALDRITRLTDQATGSILEEALAGHADHLISLLRATPTDHQDPEATAIADAILTLIHGPQEPPPQWWRTPLGTLIAPHAPEAALTNSQAADILGLKRGTISVMVHRGNLATLPDTGDGPRKISRRATLARLVPNNPNT